MKFEDLKFEPHPAGVGGVRAVHTFPNGFGVSVIRTPFSYGGDQDLYEMAILFKGGLTYDTPITDDVLGRLSPEDVERHLGEVEALTAADLKENSNPHSSANLGDVIASPTGMLKGGGS